MPTSSHSPYTLRLQPTEGNWNEITVPLYADKDTDQKPDIVFGMEIISNLRYQFQLEYPADSPFMQKKPDSRISIYINDDCICRDRSFRFEDITFPNGGIDFDGRIFLEYYGFVQIRLCFPEQNMSLHTPYLPVLVPRDPIGRKDMNESVNAMIQYLQEHQDTFLLNGEAKPRELAGLRENGYTSWDSKMILFQKIAAIYESNYGFFKANSRFRIEKVATVDRLEKVQSITPTTIQYIAEHPEQLKQVNSSVGVHVGNRVYHPQKVRFLQNYRSFDIYENRMILGFLRAMIDYIATLRNLCERNARDGYVCSPLLLLANTLEIKKQDLDRIYNKFTLLLGMYRNILPIQCKAISEIPKPTAIFLSVPQYHQMFLCMREWFRLGIYDFAKEDYMLSCIKISSLYESYIFARLIDYFQANGYTCEGKQFLYEPPEGLKWKYKNTVCNNTYVFAKPAADSPEITLYYQPVIYNGNFVRNCSDGAKLNGIGLYRNNTISLNDHDPEAEIKNDNKTCYYTPDFLIKVKSNDSSKYIILDAKFSTLQTVRQAQVPPLVFKYLFSIDPTRCSDQIAGLYIIYGKYDDVDSLEKPQSIYDKNYDNRIHTPFVKVLPVMALL